MREFVIDDKNKRDENIVSSHFTCIGRYNY